MASGPGDQAASALSKRQEEVRKSFQQFDIGVVQVVRKFSRRNSRAAENSALTSRYTTPFLLDLV